jgi:phage shock protein PspC (stress-responsive transcriptional regulator)
MTAALLAAYHYHIHFSRLGSNQVADAFFMAAAFLFLYRANDEGRPFDWVLAGIVAGLAQYWYAGARFVTIMVGVAVIWFIMRGGKRFLQAQWKGIVMLIGAFLISAGPMLQHAIRFPDDYNARLNAVGVFESGWLQLAEKTWKQGAVPILFGYQLKRAALSYNAYPDRTSWYGSPKPFFDFPMGVLFMLGLGYATLRPVNRKHFPMLIWWWGAIILGGMLTESPPSSQRLVTTGPPAVFFVALSLEQIGSIVRRVWQSITLNRLLPAFGAAAIIALSALSLNWYFNEYTPMLVYGNDTAVIATGIAHYASDHLGPDWRMYFFGPPRMYINFGSIAYLVPDIEGRDIPDPLTAPPPIDFAPNDKNAAFIFLPERRAELDLVRQTYPNGEGEVIPSPRLNDPNPLFYVYRVTK